MIGADGAGADEAHRCAGEQFAIDAGHRAHQQHVGLLQRRPVDRAAGHAADAAEAGEEGIDQRNVFVGEDTHGRLRFRCGPF
ncbi:hypothetical protein D3C77_613140 [compost metagenome]